MALLACGLACALAAAACGSDRAADSAGARRAFADTFATTATAVKSGRLSFDAKIDPEGLLAIAGPITLKVGGPFTVDATSGLPSFDLTADALVARRHFPAGALSDGRDVYLQFDGDFYKLDHGALHGLRSGKGLVGVPLLGFDPRAWVTGVQDKGTARVGGVETVHLTGGIDAPKLFADVGQLIGSRPGFDPASAKRRKQITDAVKSASVEVWSGKDDKVLRQLLVRVRFDFPAGVDPPIPGLDQGTLELRASLDDINGRQPRTSAPAGAKSFSQLPDTGTAGLVKCLTDSIRQGETVAQCAADLL
ncbi:MAG: hypothetical protein QOG15_2160 [Solirubrobacteraceae bacterium]|nr:hypothetical protein [Solirubrobacteraceae bacterium]